MQSSPHLQRQFLPALFSARGVLATLVLGQILSFLLTFSPTKQIDVWVNLGLTSLFVQFISLIALCVLYFAQHQLVRLSILKQCSAIAVAFIATTLVMSLLAAQFDTAGLESDEMWLFAANNVFLCVLVLVIFLNVLAIYAENLAKIAHLSQAQLQALQARIHPHFLYNSLNAAAELTQIDSQAAEKMLLDLAHLAQSALDTREAVSLSAEIVTAEAYLAIEKWRFGERLKVTWQLPAEIPEVRLPPMTLQPLLENAVKYGVQSLAEGGAIVVNVATTKRAIIITVENPWQAMSNTLVGSGIALTNIRARLELYFNHKASLATEKSAERFKVVITLPVKT
ncbi:sensor histidine kinase [Pseudoalteromonas fenneropenaei]|uniref:Sensor histidine kinase n=1 Tax=Pseudoalteromonas fenneropenaei TaxID=1737459 RepID=A0ABV7CMM2_9GAMM